MVKKQKNKEKTSLISRGTIIFIAIVVAAAGAGAYYVISTSTPVNSSVPVFGTPSNIYIKGIHTDQGYAYDQQSTRTGKRTLSSGVLDASFHISKGTLVALHFINEDKDTGTEMDLNIDEFNVHTRHLSYFQAQTITFIADKEGTYNYYSGLHPEMKGTITVDP